jgi:hypothetical protein
MLAVIYGGEKYRAEKARERIDRYCNEMSEICAPQSFSVQSTVRQFDRYVHMWRQDEWADLARAALEALDAWPTKREDGDVS